MTPTVAFASGTFVQSHTFTILADTVSLVAVLSFAILVLRDELPRLNGTGSGALRHLHTRAIAVPLLLCMTVIVLLRLVDIGYRHLDVPANNAPAGQVTAAPPAAARVTPAVYQSYFAGGVSSASVQSFVALLNTTPHRAGVQLAFFSGKGALATKVVTVQPTSELVVPVSSLEAVEGPFGLRVVADQQISAQLRLRRAGQDGSILAGSSPGIRWYLAEGYTGMTFHESLAILNPDAQHAAQVVLHLLPENSAVVDVSRTVAPRTQIVVDINQLAPGLAQGMIVTADRPVVVARALTFGRNDHGLATQAGVSAVAKRWTFAYGTTTLPSETFLLFLNPGAVPAQVTARFYGATGRLLATRSLTVAASQRATMRVRGILAEAQFSSVVASDQPIVVEEVEYARAPNDAYSAGAAVVGSTSPTTRQLFAAGDTSSAKSIEELHLYNPTTVGLTVEATFYGTDGKTLSKQLRIAPRARLDIDVNRLLAGFAPLHGTLLQTTNGPGFIVQQRILAPDSSAVQHMRLSNGAAVIDAATTAAEAPEEGRFSRWRSTF